MKSEMRPFWEGIIFQTDNGQKMFVNLNYYYFLSQCELETKAEIL